MSQYAIGKRVFKSKKEILLYFKMMLDLSNPPQLLDGDELAECLDLFSWHPNWEEKKGAGIHSVLIKRCGIYKTKGFWITRADGSEIDISYKNCVCQKSSSNAEIARKAAREAIADQILEFRSSKRTICGRYVCEETGDLITREEMEIDHHPIGFAELFTKFLELRGLKISEVGVVSEFDGNCFARFKDPQIAADWQLFHKKMAKLRAVRSEINQGKERLKNACS